MFNEPTPMMGMQHPMMRLGQKGNGARATPYGKGGNGMKGGGKGKGGKPQQLPLEVVEQQFSVSAKTMFESVMDMNITNVTLGQNWTKLLMDRDRLMQMYGFPPQGTGMPAVTQPKGFSKGFGAQQPAAKKAPAGLGAVTADNAKSMLNQRIQASGITLDKNTVTYDTSEALGDGNGKEFVSVCIVAGKGRFEGKPHKNKKDAEQDAAGVALRKCFPGTPVPNKPVVAKPVVGKTLTNGVATPDPDKGVTKTDPQSRLRWALNLLLDRCISKDDVVFDTSEIEGGQYQSGVRLPTLPEYSEMMYTGEPAGTPKEANANAAAIAMAQLEDVVAPIALEKEAKKKEKQLANDERKIAKFGAAAAV